MDAWVMKPLVIDDARITASSTAAGYAAANMLNDHAGVVWKSAGGAASVTITLDLTQLPAAQRSLQAALLFGCTGAAAGWTLTVEAANAADFVAGYVLVADTLPFLAGATFPSHGRGVGYFEAAAAVVNRTWWRFTVGGLANAQVTVARIVFGQKLQLDRNFGFGGGWGVRDLGKVDFSAAGVRIRRRAAKLRTIGISFPAVRKDEVENVIQPLIELCGGQEPIVLVTDPEANALRQQRCWFGHLTGELGAVWRTAASWEWRANLVDLIPIPRGA